MICMSLPRPPLRVDVTPSFWDVVATVMGIVAAWGTAAVLVLVTLAYAWQIVRAGGGRHGR
jgi:tetrahydromethanopterin S-methyltransferase subunit E